MFNGILKAIAEDGKSNSQTAFLNGLFLRNNATPFEMDDEEYQQCWDDGAYICEKIVQAWPLYTGIDGEVALRNLGMNPSYMKGFLSKNDDTPFGHDERAGYLYRLIISGILASNP